MIDQIELGKWWNAAVLPLFQKKVEELMAQGATRAEANDAIVRTMLMAVRRRHQRFFDRINQKG